MARHHALGWCMHGRRGVIAAAWYAISHRELAITTAKLGNHLFAHSRHERREHTLREPRIPILLRPLLRPLRLLRLLKRVLVPPPPLSARRCVVGGMCPLSSVKR